MQRNTRHNLILIFIAIQHSVIHDFYCDKAGDMYLPPLAEKVRYYKEDEEGNGSMCRIVEEEVRRGEERGVRIGAKQTKERTALAMIKDGTLSLEKIADFCGLTLDEVKELAKKQSA